MHLSAKPPQRQDLPPRKWPQGGSETTTSIGRRRKRGNAFNRPVLIPRAACSVYFPFHAPRERTGAPHAAPGARRGIHLDRSRPSMGGRGNRLALSNTVPGAHGGVVIPVPIPNTEVKGPIGESTAGVARGRVARRRVSLRGRIRSICRIRPLAFFHPNPCFLAHCIRSVLEGGRPL